MKNLIVIPVYNERENISPLIAEIDRHLPKTDILFIDDNSPDGSAATIKKIQQTRPSIHLIERPKKLGLGSAYVAGFKWALQNNYDYIFEMDGDFSHDPKYLPQLLKTAQLNNMSLGSRYITGGGIENWNVFRRLLSRAGSIYAKTLLKLPYQDLTGGFKCFSSSVLKALNLDEIRSDGYCFQIEMTYKAHQKGFQIQEIPIVFKERRAGKSKISRKIVFEAIWRVAQLSWS